MSRVDWMLLRNANALCRATPGRDAAGKSCGGSLQKMGAGRGAGGGVHNQVASKQSEIFSLLYKTHASTQLCNLHKLQVVQPRLSHHTMQTKKHNLTRVNTT